MLITGSTGGIGQALVERFSAEGAHLMLIDRNAAALQEQAKRLGGNAEYCVCDVSDEVQTQAAFDSALARFKTIDIAVLNAGIEGRIGELEIQSADDFDKVIAVNLRGVFLWLSRLMKIMNAQNGGVITITSSTAGLRGAVGLAPYVASKHAVIGLMKCAALEGAKHNVRVNTINPGPIDTRMMLAIEEGTGPASEIRAKIEAATPLKRYGTPAEVASLIAFISSEEAAYSTGTTFVMDGGGMAGQSR